MRRGWLARTGDEFVLADERRPAASAAHGARPGRCGRRAARRATSRPPCTSCADGRRCAKWDDRAGEDPLDPVGRRLRPRRQLRRRLPPAAHRRRGAAGLHRELLQPHRLRRVARSAHQPGRRRATSSRASRSAASFPRSTSCSPGYQGGEGIADVILDAVARVKAANPHAVYACDPVMGNAKSGCFVAPAIPVLLRERVVPGGRHHHAEPVRARLPHRHRAGHARLRRSTSADLARAMGPRTVLVTSVERPDRRGGTIEMLAVNDSGAWIVQTPLHPDEGERLGRRDGGAVHGALPRDRRCRRRPRAHDVERVRPAERTHESGERELQLVESQESYAHPRMQFAPRRVR